MKFEILFIILYNHNFQKNTVILVNVNYLVPRVMKNKPTTIIIMIISSSSTIGIIIIVIY